MALHMGVRWNGPPQGGDRERSFTCGEKEKTIHMGVDSVFLIDGQRWRKSYSWMVKLEIHLHKGEINDFLHMGVNGIFFTGAKRKTLHKGVMLDTVLRMESG